MELVSPNPAYAGRGLKLLVWKSNSAHGGAVVPISDFTSSRAIPPRQNNGGQFQSMSRRCSTHRHDAPEKTTHDAN